MKNTQPYPLLIQGFYENLNNTGSSIIAVAATPISWKNSILEGRGDMVMLDMVATNSSGPNFSPAGFFNLSIGSDQVLTNNEASRYSITSLPRSYEILSLKQPAGQTIALSYLPLTTVGLMAHIYFENQFAIPSIINARHTNKLKQRIQEFSVDFATQQRLLESASIPIPTGLGNVVAVELHVTSDTVSDVVNTSVLTMAVNGVEIFKDVASGIFLDTCGRPGLIFPILIRGGSNFVLRANTQFATDPADVLHVGVRLYFDDDMTGEKMYS